MFLMFVPFFFLQTFIAIGELLLSLNWALLADILLVRGLYFSIQHKKKCRHEYYSFKLALGDKHVKTCLVIQ